MKTELKDVADDATDLYADVVSSLRKMSKHVREDGGDALSESTQALMQSALELAEQAKEQSGKAIKMIGHEAREHPASTAAIVAAAVALIGLAVAGRKAAKH